MNRLRFATKSFVSRFIAVLILSSVAVSQLALVSTLAEQSTMPCCVGKTDGHCESGLMAPKTPEPVSEPMCGLTSAATPALDLDAVTVVSEPVRAESHDHSATPSSSSVAESNTVEKECQMDCGACATATSRHKRDNVVLARLTPQSPTATIVHFENTNSFLSANEYWTQISPRGPPANL